MSIQSNRVQWWNLDRGGFPLDPKGIPLRPTGAPPLKDGSIYTPNFLLPNGELPPAHLHHEKGRIIGIHGESDLAHLKLTLDLCLRLESWIIKELAPRHHFDIMLSDVVALLDQD